MFHLKHKIIYQLQNSGEPESRFLQLFQCEPHFFPFLYTKFNGAHYAVILKKERKKKEPQTNTRTTVKPIF